MNARMWLLSIGNSNNISIQELTETVRDQLAPEREILCESAREVDAEHTHVSVETASKVVGYELSLTTSEGVEEFIQWHQATRE